MAILERERERERERKRERERVSKIRGECNTERKVRVFIGVKGSHSVIWRGTALSRKNLAYSTSKL